MATVPLLLGALGTAAAGIAGGTILTSEHKVDKPKLDTYKRLKDIASRFSYVAVKQGLRGAFGELRNDDSLTEDDKRLVLRLAASEYKWNPRVKDRLQVMANNENLESALLKSADNINTVALWPANLPEDLKMYDFSKVKLAETTKRGRPTTINGLEIGSRQNDYDYDTEARRVKARSSADESLDKAQKEVVDEVYENYKPKVVAEAHKEQVQSTPPETTVPMVSTGQQQRGDPANLPTAHVPNDSVPTQDLPKGQTIPVHLPGAPTPTQQPTLSWFAEGARNAANAAYNSLPPSQSVAEGVSNVASNVANAAYNSLPNMTAISEGAANVANATYHSLPNAPNMTALYESLPNAPKLKMPQAATDVVNEVAESFIPKESIPETVRNELADKEAYRQKKLPPNVDDELKKILVQPISVDHIRDIVEGRSPLYVSTQLPTPVVLFFEKDVKAYKKLYTKVTGIPEYLHTIRELKWDAYRKTYPDLAVELREVYNQIRGQAPGNQAGQPPRFHTSITESEEPEVPIRTDITPVISVPRAAASFASDTAMYGLGVLGVYGATSVGGPLAGAAASYAISNTLNLWANVNRARGYSERFGSQMAYEFQKKLVAGEKLAYPESAAPQIINPLLTATEGARTSVPLTEAFARTLSRGSNLDLGHRDWVNWYSDATSPWATEGPAAK
jgi:hypothetical protein